MSVSETLADLTTRIADLYKEIVTNSVRFEELRRTTTETLFEFKHALERMADKVDALQRDQIQGSATLKAEIQILGGRLEAISEKALHVAVRDAAKEVAEDHLRKGTIALGSGSSYDSLPQKQA